MIGVSEKEFSLIHEVIRRYAADCDIFAFGSRYKQMAKKYSDLDLAFDNGKPLSIARIQQLEEAFDESVLPYRVDVVDYCAISEEFRTIIDQGNERIFRGKR
ncbi:MAG: nucleotidyltransferase domain-containing protein [Lactobacillales bacterium]|jgi:predicted nucleotidyltransferase|nr:nucleotidyltransferase domain-containing protein [Lactobacillales bacterium]